jgi:hypothetical protein
MNRIHIHLDAARIKMIAVTVGITVDAMSTGTDEFKTTTEASQ